MITKLIRERYGRRLLDGGGKNVDKKNGLKEEVNKDLGEAGLLAAGEKEPAQKPLFGDLDLVVNTLETEASAIGKQIEKDRESIKRKEDEISELEERLGNIRTSLARLRAKAKEEAAQAGEKKEAVPF
jgi:chromosome segregation ATPase